MWSYRVHNNLCGVPLIMQGSSIYDPGFSVDSMIYGFYKVAPSLIGLRRYRMSIILVSNSKKSCPVEVSHNWSF